MQAHYRPYPFATIATGVNFSAGLYTITQDEGDWQRTIAALDWCLEHAFVETKKAIRHEAGQALDFRLLHRCLDVAFAASCASYDTIREGCNPTSEPRFASPERQKLYSLWKYCLHLLSESQSGNGEWLGPYDDKEVFTYSYALRHRLYILYSLTTYLENRVVPPEDTAAISKARDRQFWLCANAEILRDHYGICTNNPVMPTGLWGMILAELIQPGITLPQGVSK